MSTDSDDSRPGSVTDSIHAGPSSHTETDSEPGSPTGSTSKTAEHDAGKSAILLAEDPFSSEESRLLFEAIDKLRSRGAGQDLNLPQLVIVGKQSVGKSSLLESLTDIPFPVGDDLCTRFATRVISRRTAPDTSDMIRVSIEEGDVDPFGDSKESGTTGDFNPPVDQKLMTAEYFQDLVGKASIAMGTSGDGGSPKSFSSKVLKIELSGPRRSHFGILDLPGIFDIPTGPVTTREKEGVEKMVIAYMQKPENIIICVADAFENLANQRILKLAEDHADNERVVGVFTKCDLVVNPERIVTIVEKNEATSGKPLRHGWFVVQNRGIEDSSASFDREKAERSTFGKNSWLKVEERRRGTTKLKNFLSSLLCRRIREGFPGMQNAVQVRLELERKKLAALGEPRDGLGKQKAYLSGIALRFQTLANMALNNPQDLSSVDMKLRGMADAAKDKFAEELRLKGHLYEFFAVNEPETAPIGSSQINGEAGVSADRKSKGDRILYDEIKSQIRENKGYELQGMVNPAVLKPLFRKQATKWPKIAERHLENLATMTEEVVLRILQVACQESGAAEYTREDLEQIVVRFAKEARSAAIQKLEKYRWEENFLPLHTNNPAFIEGVKEAQLLRFRAALERYTKKTPPRNFMVRLVEAAQPGNVETIPHDWKDWIIIDQDTVGSLFKELHSHTDKNTEDEIHDLLKAYYEVVREDFITHINRHIAEPFLQDVHGPVTGFCTTYINNLSDEETEELGAEHESTVTARKTIEATIRRLEDAEEIAKRAFRRTKALG